jgi:hypothetical protein
MRLVILPYALVAAIALAAPAQAQPQRLGTQDDLVQSQLFMGYLRGTLRNQMVIDTVAAMDRKYGQACTQPYLVRMVSITVVRPVLIGPGSLAPDDGIWSEKLSAQRCGRTSVVNILFVAGETPVPRPVELLPGMTAASPELMRDVLPMATAGALGVAEKQKPDARNCKTARVTDTSEPTVTGDKRSEPGSTIGRIWFETWSFDVCGTPAQVKVTFSDNLVTKGTNFAVGL